ncbi:MAG: hypothetical protein DME42_10365, partial [Verrucomicrobia bacterium]
SREQDQKKTRNVSHPATKGENAGVVQRQVAEARHPARRSHETKLEACRPSQAGSLTSNRAKIAENAIIIKTQGRTSGELA